MIQPLFNAQDDEWVVMTGRYILNMGALEFATRVLIATVTGGDKHPIFSDSLAARLGFLRTRFPREDRERHSWAMNAFAVANQQLGFRNIVAHSPVLVSGRSDGTFEVQGILGLTPRDPDNIGHIVSLQELKNRVTESATVSRAVLEMQADYAAVRDNGAQPMIQLDGPATGESAG